MREIFNLDGKKQRVNTIEDALRIVRESYPGAYKQGCVGAWCFYYPTCKTENMVAEAWIIQGKNPGWWLVVKRKQS